MSGRVFRFLGRTDYNYSGLGQGASSGEVPIALDIDISGAREITLLVRTHAISLQGSGTGAKFTVIARASAPTSDEPNSYFRDTQALVTTDLATSGAPFLTRATIPANAGAWLSVFLKATQGGTAGQTVTGTFSMDVSLKD